MALYQVVEHSGQKSLIDVAAGGGSVAVPAPYNTETWITESGTFTAPVTGWYAVWMIGGGTGGYVVASTRYASGGLSGTSDSFLEYIEAGTEVPVTIGAGSSGVISTPIPEAAPASGGQTKFGDHECRFDSYIGGTHTYAAVGGNAYSFGAGPGGGAVNVAGLDGSSGSGRFYGAGGVAYYTEIQADVASSCVGSGAQGAVRLRYYDPNKSSN